MLLEIEILLITLVSFLIPTQLALHLDSLTTFVYGFKIDYLTPTIYLSDLAATSLLVVWFLKNRIKVQKKHFLILLLTTLFIFLNVYVSISKIAAFYKWIKLIELVLLGYVLYAEKRFKKFDHFIKPLSYSVFLASLVGVLQWFKGGSLGGLLYLFGERSFNLTNPGISTFSLFGETMLRPYSIFSHPNSFAGFLVVFLFLLFPERRKFNPLYFKLLIFIILINLVLTASLNVYITLMAIFLVWIIGKRKNFSLALLLLDFSTRTFTHRLELVNTSWKMIKQNILLGVGLNNFIPNLVNVSNKYLNSWELQPVHNLYLLILSETGLIGLAVFILIITKSVLNFPLLLILISGFFDHYWFTLQQNLLLFVFVLSLSSGNKRK